MNTKIMTLKLHLTLQVVEETNRVPESLEIIKDSIIHRLRNELYDSEKLLTSSIELIEVVSTP